MADVKVLHELIMAELSESIQHSSVALGELTIEVLPENIQYVCRKLHDHPAFDFKLLIDVCGVDYLYYGLSEWQTESATTTGFERGVEANFPGKRATFHNARFATVYHLLSLQHNQRIRIRALLDAEQPVIDTVTSIWPAANWYEREAFDLYGILFNGHPDLRRILTDYGFQGYPFRKDFPMIGEVEVRYDAKLQRVVYEPVSINNRVLEPKVIRDDNRYRVGE